MGLRDIRRHLGYRVGDRVIPWLHREQAELDRRVPNGWKVDVGVSSRTITAGELCVSHSPAGDAS